MVVAPDDRVSLEPLAVATATERDAEPPAEPSQIEIALGRTRSDRIGRSGFAGDHPRLYPPAMIGPPRGARIWLAAGFTDLRRGFDGLAALVQTRLDADPFSGQVFVFRGRRGVTPPALSYTEPIIISGVDASRLHYGAANSNP